MSTSSLPSFIKIYQAILKKKLKMWKFTDGRRRTTDGRTDDGRCAMTMIKVKVFVYGRRQQQQQQQQRRRGYDNSSPDFRHGELKRWRSRSHVKNLGYHPKGLVIRNTHSIYDSPISYDKNVIHNVQVCWQTDKVITIGLPPSGGALIKAHFFLENMSFDLLTFRL